MEITGSGIPKVNKALHLKLRWSTQGHGPWFHSEHAGFAKADADSAQLPVIALTALAMPGDQERCFQAGVDAYFSKPVRMRSLYREIERLLQN